MSDKSINASDGQENVIKHEYLGREVLIGVPTQRFRWSNIGNLRSWANNGYDSSVNPQDSIETKV